MESVSEPDSQISASRHQSADNLVKNALRRIPDVPGELNALRHANPAEFWHIPLYWCFWLSIAFFPIGYGFREVMPPLCFIFLVAYYRHAWRDSVLRNLRVAWLFACVALMTIIGVIFSIHPLDSLWHAGTGMNKAFILPFIAMECVREEKEARRLIWACALACFWEGLDGLWQAASGHDFIMNYPPNAGRLTGSLGDYTVGNYLALALVPAFAIWFPLREKLGLAAAVFVFTTIFWPAFFLFQGASSRSGILAIAGALALWTALSRRWLDWRLLTRPALAILAFIICQPERLMPGQVAADNRWDLWRLGWRVFCEHPLLGAGAGQYNTAFRQLGLAPQVETITISHPHNLYLDMLYAHGLVGFSLGMTFLAGFAIWGWRQIKPALRTEIAHGGFYWHYTAWFWLGFAAWLINGIFGHDFYRIWWLAQAMSSLGMMIGAVANGKRQAFPR